MNLRSHGWKDSELCSPRCGTSGPAVQNPEEIIWRGFVDPEAVSRSLKLPPSYRDIVRFCCGQGRHLTCRSEAGRAEVEAPTIRMLEPECQFLEASQAEHRRSDHTPQYD